MKLQIHKASTVQPKPVRWLWPGRIPQGMITVLCGNPGVGKGLISCDLVAAVTTGRAFPDTPHNNEPMEAAMLFCEDGEADTVRPRLEAAGADLDKVHFIKSVLKATNAGEADRMFALDKDVAELEKMLEANPAIKLVVIDPASSYLGNARMEKEQEIRRMLGPLAQLAERLGLTFLLVMHNNKRGDVNALHRVMGAVAMSGVARMVWMCAQDQDDADNYFFLCAKVNIGRMLKGLQYGIGVKGLPIIGDTAFIVWKGATDVSADQALTLKEGESGKLTEAKQWLSGYLDADKSAAEVFKAAEKAGIREKTLKRAKKSLGIESDKTTDGWIWLAPTMLSAPDVLPLPGAQAAIEPPTAPASPAAPVLDDVIRRRIKEIERARLH
jgi:putative DNA primase/helicase